MSQVDGLILQLVERLSVDLPEWADLDHPLTSIVRDLASQVGRFLAEMNLSPDRIVPSADGDIAFYFFGADSPPTPLKFASITCTEEGELVLLKADRSQRFSKAVQISTDKASVQSAIQQIEEFIETCPAL